MRWLVQLAVLTIVLLFGVFIGIDRAEQNMQAIQGTEGAARVFEMSVPEEGKMEISVLGQEYETVPPFQEEQMEQSTNFLSHIGNKTGEALEWAARKIIDRFVTIVDKLIP